MKNDSGHFGPDNLLPPPAVQPSTKDESREWAERFRAASQTTAKYVPAWDEFPVTVNAWASVPKPIRFAVWLWALSVIVGVIALAVGVAVWGTVIITALSQM